MQNLKMTIAFADGNEAEIQEQNFKQGSLYITKSSITSTDFEIGTANIGEMGVTLFDSGSRRVYYGAEIKLFYAESPDSTPEPMGVYTVSEPTKPTPETVSLVCYDNMAKLDKDLELTDAEAEEMAMYELEPYNMLSHLCTIAGVGFGNTPVEIAAMPNGTKRIGWVYGAALSSDMCTFRDAVADIAQLLGGFAYMDREGKLRIKSYAASPSVTVESDLRMSSSVSDFIKHISGVYLEITPSAPYYLNVTCPEEPGEGSVIQLRDSPFFRYHNRQTVEGYVSEIAQALMNIYYVPSEADVFLPPGIEPGDMICYTGGATGEGVNTLITSVDWTYRGTHRLVSSGTETAQSSIKSSTQKQIEMLSGVTAEKVSRVYTYTPGIIYITPERQRIFKTELTISAYSAAQQLSGQIVYEMGEPGTVTAQYRLDGELLSEIVSQHSDKGMNTMNLFLPLEGESGKHTLEVFISCDTGYGISRNLEQTVWEDTDKEKTVVNVSYYGIYAHSADLEEELKPLYENSLSLTSSAEGEWQP